MAKKERTKLTKEDKLKAKVLMGIGGSLDVFAGEAGVAVDFCAFSACPCCAATARPPTAMN